MGTYAFWDLHRPDPLFSPQLGPVALLELPVAPDVS